MAAKKKLTEKQKRFCDFYIKYGEAVKAAIEAGYTKNYANAQSYRMLEDVGLKEYIDARLQQLASERIAGADEVLRYLTAVLRGQQKEPIPMLCGDGCQRLVSKDVGAKERIKAAELLAKRYGLLTENVNLTGDVGVQIIDDIPKNNS
jgi:phage terminase small subunit